MDNNDILIRLRYALEIKNKEMAEIFKLGGVDVTVPEVIKVLTKSDEYDAESDEQIKCNNSMLDSFLNGFIIYKRGKQEPKRGQSDTPDQSIRKNENVNNLLLKKVKIALALTTEDMLVIFENAGITVTKGELGALLRKEGHKNYKECGDKYARNFLKGLAIKYRG
ncbi:cytoplasmic protein [Bacillus freudenreichii]|nr:cytoplasmic protein [Bacillus freudenreichii]